MAGDPRSTAEWRRLVAQVVLEEPLCTLQFPGCTGTSTTADHIQTVKDRPDLALDRTNLRGACKACNDARGSLPNESLILGGATNHRPRALDIFKPLDQL